MPLLIDGHNLIGQMTGLSLEDEHDEVELILRLRSYHAHAGRRITVIFDHGLPGGASKLSTGGVSVVFASCSTDADRLIVQRIRKNRHPRALTVVTSDHKVARAALDGGANVIASDVFARQLETTATSPPNGDAKQDDPNISQAEVVEWLHLFGQDAPDS